MFTGNEIKTKHIGRGGYLHIVMHANSCENKPTTTHYTYNNNNRLMWYMYRYIILINIQWKINLGSSSKK